MSLFSHSRIEQSVTALRPWTGSLFAITLTRLPVCKSCDSCNFLPVFARNNYRHPCNLHILKEGLAPFPTCMYHWLRLYTLEPFHVIHGFSLRFQNSIRNAKIITHFLWSGHQVCVRSLELMCMQLYAKVMKYVCPINQLPSMY